MAKARALRRALDKPGYIGGNERIFVIFYYAEIGRKGGEVVVGYLGPRGRYLGEQRRFAHVRKAYYADVGNYFELEQDNVLLRLFALLGEVGGVAAGGGEADVALTSPAALGKKAAFAVGEHVADELLALVVAHDGADGHLYYDILATLARAPVGAAALAVAGDVFVGKAEGQQVVHRPVGEQVDVTALAAVAAVGAARRLALIRLEGVHTVAAVAGLDGYAHPVGKYVLIYHINRPRARLLTFCRRRQTRLSRQTRRMQPRARCRESTRPPSP